MSVRRPRLVRPDEAAPVPNAAYEPSDRARALREELFGQDFGVTDVAFILACDRATVLRYLKDGHMAGFKVGRTWHIPEQAVREFRAHAIAVAHAQQESANGAD